MFGFITASIEYLDESEKVRYRSLYCGLCQTLKTRCGQQCRGCLTFDLTFLTMLYESLYEPEENRGMQRCILHPRKPHLYACSPYTDYAADLTVALAYHKCLDDWYDDHAVPARTYAALLSQPYRAVHNRIPRQCEEIERGLTDIRTWENAQDVPVDAVANRFGDLLGELFVYEQDPWAETLRQIGRGLGRFIYMMDAAIDYDRDLKTGSYNPLVNLKVDPVMTREPLMSLLGSATAAFERLPLQQDIHILRSVLYAGVWQRFNERYGTPVQEEPDSVSTTRTSMSSSPSGIIPPVSPDLKGDDHGSESL